MPILEPVEHGETVDGPGPEPGVYAVRVKLQVKLPGLVALARFGQAERSVVQTILIGRAACRVAVRTFIPALARAGVSRKFGSTEAMVGDQPGPPDLRK